MTRFAILLPLLFVTTTAIAQEAPGVGAVIGAQSDPRDFDLAREKVADCDGEKFVFAWGAGAQPTKVTLCSRKDATHEQVVGMLEEAAAKIEQASSIPEDRRTALAQQIRGKIRELEGRTAAAAPAAEAPAQPAPVAAAPATAVSQPSAPVASTTPPPLKPLLPKPAAAMPPRPRLSFECYTPGDIGSGGPCISLARDTRLTVKAGEVLTPGTALRFIRNGDQRAEVALGALRKGEAVRIVMPAEVCRGVVESEVEIRVIRSGQSVDKLGPYLLRC